MKIKTNKNGYIALITLLLVGAIVLIAVIAITFVSLNQKSGIISHNRTIKNYYLANACANYAILQLQKNLEYQGHETLTIDENLCQVEAVSGSGNFSRIIITSSQINNQMKKIKIELEQVKPMTIIKSWGESFD